MKSAIMMKEPIKIDVGAVYNRSPRESRTHPHDFIPQQHELVFDIDISDYDDVRNCCKESNICEKCWPFMKIGAKVLHRILSEEFGFKHFLFVFSGRRGFHCWVCDKEARELSSDARRAIADYLMVVVGGQAMVKRVTLPPTQGIHPMIAKALDVIDEDFEDLMVDKQDFLATDQLVQSVIDLCDGDSRLRQNLSDICKLPSLKSSRERWTSMKQINENFKNKRNKANYFIHEVKLQHCFPRLDINVTKGMNHLLKLPFCVHPKTGNVCVPFTIDQIDKFDLSRVPNLRDMSDEDMAPYKRTMEAFLSALRR